MPRCPTPFGNALRRASGHAHGGGVSVAEPERARPPTAAAANRRAGPPAGNQTFKPSASRASRRIAFAPLSAVFTSLAVASWPG